MGVLRGVENRVVSGEESGSMEGDGEKGISTKKMKGAIRREDGRD